MKRNSTIKTIALSTVLSIVLAGCGASSTSSDIENEKIAKDNISSITINGKAIDGYLQYATVCLDLSQDGYCQEGEPTAQTTENGSFNLEIKPDIQIKDTFTEAMLLVYGGKDVDTGEDFRGKLLATKETEVVNISPITTLVAKAVQKELKKDTKLTKEQMKEIVKVHKEKIAKIFDIEIENITKDPVAEKDTNPKLIKEALKIQKAVESMSRASDDNDALEEVYEKLVEKLDKVEDARGIDSLLDISFTDDKKLLEATKAINRNIEKSFEKFEGDLEKVAFITKEDLKKIKDKRFDEIELDDEDDIFKSDYKWDSAFIKSSLENIGIKNPTQDQINKIKDEIKQEINPRVILENIEKFENSEDEVLKEINEKIKEKKEEEKKREQFKKAQNDGKIVKFKKGMSFFDFYPKTGGYEEIKLDEEILKIKEYHFINNDFQESDMYDEEISYILKNGNWIQENEENLSYTINENGVMTLPDRGYKVTILNQEDISEEERYSVLMPKGSFVSILQIEQLEDQYRLFGEVANGTNSYNSISDYIKSQCEIGHYKGTKGTKCNENTKKGETKEGKWSIETVDNIEILIEKNKYDYKNSYASIFALKDQVLYAGSVNFKKANSNLEYYLNDIAIDAYKKAIINGELPVYTHKNTMKLEISPSPLENF